MSSITKIKAVISAQKQKLSYVIINVMMAVMGFAKSYITMKYLGFYEVGLIAMVQALIEFISMLQLGMLNGGFRMFFVNTKSVNKKINAMLFSYFGILLLVLLTAIGLYVLFTGGTNLQTGLLAIGVIIGVFTLARTWINNLLIARQELTLLNKLNVWSTALLSFLFLFLVPYYGLTGCILLIISQPVFFILFALWKKTELRPGSFVF